MLVDVKMVSDRDGETENGKPFPKGSEVDYLGHLGWGAIKVRLANGSVEVVHPHCFAALR